MANEKNKPLTTKEIAKKNLEYVLYRDALAANNYQFGISNGQIGVDNWLQGSYEDVTRSPDFTQHREAIYDSKKKAYQEGGIFGEPAMPTNADIAREFITILRRSLEQVTLADLYDVMKSIDPVVNEYKISGVGGDLCVEDIYRIAEEQGAIIEKDGNPQLDIEKLGSEIHESLVCLQDLKSMYGESCKEDLRIRRRKMYLEMKSKQRDEHFHPKEEKKVA